MEAVLGDAKFDIEEITDNVGHGVANKVDLKEALDEAKKDLRIDQVAPDSKEIIQELLERVFSIHWLDRNILWSISERRKCRQMTPFDRWKE